MTKDSPLVDFRRRGAGGWLTLNRPGRRNALTPELIADLGRGLVALLASRSPASVAAAKRAVQRCAPRPWDEVVAEDMEVFRRHWNGPDLREGVQAFRERRDPRYAAP
jgi:enoyl-CoA hydratase/carnithine racemase